MPMMIIGNVILPHMVLTAILAFTNDAAGLGTSRNVPASISSFTIRLNYRDERKCRQSYEAGYGTTRRCGLLCGGGYSINYLGWKK